MQTSPTVCVIRQVDDLGHYNRFIDQQALAFFVEMREARAPCSPANQRQLLEVLCQLVPQVAEARFAAKGGRSLAAIVREDEPGIEWIAACLAVLLQRDFYPSVGEFAIQRLRSGRFGFAFAYKDLGHAGHCGRTALRVAELLSFAAGESAIDSEVELRSVIAEFRLITSKHALNHNLREILEKADARSIPWRRISNDLRYAQLGQGCKMHRFSGVLSDLDGLLSYELQNSKLASHRILGSSGLPVPKAKPVTSEAEAVAAARMIGFPVVLKPDNLGEGVGVYIGLRNEEEVREAYAKAVKLRATLMVEAFVPGADHRMLVIDHKLIAVAKRIAAHVVGDGTSSIGDLVREVNKDPRRKRRYTTVMYEIAFDEEVRRVLQLAGLTPNSVPAEGQVIFLKRTANISSGGSAVDVTEQTHPDNVRMAERAAQAMGMGVAGIDFITTDITRSHFEIGGAICEVNAAPGMGPHRAADPTRDVTSPILSRAFPKGEDGRIPTAAVTGTTGKTTTCRMLAAILARSGVRVGCATTDGVNVGGELVMEGDVAGRTGADLIFSDPTVEAAVLETARGGIVMRGLAFDRCDVAAITNVGPDHLGEYGIDTVEQMAAVKGRVLRAARKAVAINADDPLILPLREVCSAAREILFAANGRNPMIDAHLQAGGTALVIEEGRSGKIEIDLLHANRRDSLAIVEELPATFGGIAIHNAENALCAAALAVGMDQDLDVIRGALASFKPDMEDSPGRLSFIDGLPFGLLIDFAHNPAQLDVLTRFAGRYDTKGQRICLMTVGGNRSEAHIRACGSSVAGHFDRYLCYERQDLLRGRKRGEIAGLLRQGMIDGGVSESKIEAGLDIWDAIDHAVEHTVPGDFVVILATAWPNLVPAFRRAAAEKFPDWPLAVVAAPDTGKGGRGSVLAGP